MPQALFLNRGKMSYIKPSIGKFQEFFSRDFPFGSDPATSVTDDDLKRAQLECGIQINPSLFSSQNEYTLAFNYLTAHYLTMNLRESSQGISGSFEWPYQSKGVGSVSVSQAIPPRVLENPIFLALTKTNYGTKYLLMILPLLSGQMFIAEGGTLA